MSLQDSPVFDGADVKSPHKPTVHDWIQSHRRLLLILIGVFIVLDVLLLLFLFAGSDAVSTAPGGLDGCLVDAAGRTVTGEITIAGVTRSTDPGGCFFFPSLPPGSHVMQVLTAGGLSLTTEVTVISGEAVPLDTVSVSQ